MNKLLIGITGISNHVTRSCAAIIAEEFGVEHINMRQPVINMIAALHQVEPTYLEHNVPGDSTLESIKTSIHDLEITLSFNLRTLNKDFFINEVKAAMARSRTKVNQHLFSGHLITGITSENEAQWLRDQGGLLLHLYHYDSKTPVNHLHEKEGDIPVVINNKAPTAAALETSLAAIQAALNLKKAA